MIEEKQVKLRNLFAYGMGDLYGGGAFTLIGLYLMIFLTKSVGLSGTLAGLVFGLGRVWDAVTDPLMGYISDKTKSKYGRRRVFFLLGIIPVGLSLLPMWLMPFGKGTNEYILFFYYLISYMFFNTVYTMMMTPYSALNADMSIDYKVRSRLSGFRMGFSQISSLISGVLAPIIVGSYIKPVDGYFYMALCFAVFYAVIWIFIFLGTFEREDLEQVDNTKFSFREVIYNFVSTLKNKSFRMHLGMYIFAFISLDAINSILFFYLNNYLRTPTLKPVATAALFGSEVCVVAIYIYLANKKGKARSFQVGLFISIIAFLSLSLLTPENANVYTIIFFFAFIGIGFSAGNVMPFAILPEVVDVDELITSKDRAGTYAGFMTFARKFTQGVVVLPLLGVCIDLIGYNPNLNIQAFHTDMGFKILLIVVPIIVIIIAIIFSYKYKVTPKTHAILRKEIERLKNGGRKEDVTHDVKKVCEILTGFKYEKLFDEQNYLIKKFKKA
ncbi:MAG TPA: MFS transporter [Victivallales bacterium]|nr:MFS transporter [Victivallales bacterium]